MVQTLSDNSKNYTITNTLRKITYSFNKTIMGTTDFNERTEQNGLTDLQRFKLLLEIPDYVITEFYSEIKEGLKASLTMKIDKELYKVTAIGVNVVELSARMNEAYRAILPFVKQREFRNDKLYN